MKLIEVELEDDKEIEIKDWIAHQSELLDDIYSKLPTNRTKQQLSDQQQWKNRHKVTLRELEPGNVVLLMLHDRKNGDPYHSGPYVVHSADDKGFYTLCSYYAPNLFLRHKYPRHYITFYTKSKEDVEIPDKMLRFIHKIHYRAKHGKTYLYRVSWEGYPESFDEDIDIDRLGGYKGQYYKDWAAAKKKNNDLDNTSCTFPNKMGGLYYYNRDTGSNTSEEGGVQSNNNDDNVSQAQQQYESN